MLNVGCTFETLSVALQYKKGEVMLNGSKLVAKESKALLVLVRMAQVRQTAIPMLFLTFIFSQLQYAQSVKPKSFVLSFSGKRLNLNSLIKSPTIVFSIVFTNQLANHCLFHCIH